MNEPQIVVLQDGTHLAFVVVREDEDVSAPGEPPVWHLLAWPETFGHAQEYVRDWHIGRERSDEEIQDARRAEARERARARA